MRPRTELALALGLVSAIGVVVAAAGSRGSRQGSGDPRRSTYLAGPAGARAYAEALELAGVKVIRFRRRTIDLTNVDAPGAVYAALDPAAALSPLEALRVRELARRGTELLLAGDGSAAVMRCYGFEPAARALERAVVAADTLRIGAVLMPTADRATRRRGLLDDGSDVPCPRVVARAADTLLRTESGRAVAIRLTPDSGAAVTLVSDGSLFANRALRASAAGEFTLGLLVGRAERVMFDEYHHGFGPSGGMLAAVRSWSFRSPVGWALWQVLAVGLIAVLAAAVRFGPARAAIERRRRSPLEHVRALATALAAAHGRDVGVRLIVRGLARRLSRGGEVATPEPGAWLDAVGGQVHTTRGREAVNTLRALTRGPAGADGVLRAAIAVEDVWDDLKR